VLRAEKQDFVAELEEIYRESSAIIVTHYHNLTVSQITELRKKLKSKGAGFKIVKNTLSKIAANNTGLEGFASLCSGPVAIAYSQDVVEVIKNIVEFSKANENLKIVGGIVEKQIVNEGQVQAIAKLPSFNELKAQIIGLLQAPAANIARIINTPAGNLARVIKAYSDTKN
jgi:large subunit ribosomal protein L10